MGLGWPSWAPWANDAPEQEPAPKPEPSAKPKQHLTPWAGTRMPPHAVENVGKTKVERNGGPWPYSGGARKPLEQYLGNSGWVIPPAEERPAPADNIGMLDPGSVQNLTLYNYRLNPWERDQAAAAYGGIVDEKDNPEIIGDSYQSYKLKNDSWGTLTPAQQSAIQFNGMLTSAVEADRNEVAPEDRSDYDSRVADVFGQHGGSSTYAPNTLAMMEAMGAQMRGQDIDEYLSYDRAFTMDEVMGMPEGTAPEMPNYIESTPFGADDFKTARSQETGIQLDLAVAALAGEFVAGALATQPGWDDRSKISSGLGQVAPLDQTPVGFYPTGTLAGPSGLTEEQIAQDAFYKGTYQALRTASSGYTLDSLWADLAGKGLTEPQIDDLFNYYWLMSDATDRQGIAGDGWVARDEFLASIGMGA